MTQMPAAKLVAVISKVTFVQNCRSLRRGLEQW